MQYCGNCGSPIAGNVCQNCGYRVAQIVEQPQQVQRYPQQQPSLQKPAPSKGKSNLPLILSVIAIVAVVIIALILLFVISPNEDGNGDGKTPAVSMSWIEDDESSGDFTGSVVSISPAKPIKIDDITVIVSYEGESMAASLDYLSGSYYLDVGGLVFDYEDINSNSKLGAEDIFTITDASSDVTIKMVYSPTGGQMYYETVSVTISTPRGALSFKESSSVDGNYTGCVISLSDEVKLVDSAITIIDSSTGASASQDPITSEQPISTGTNGMTLTFTDANANSKVDAGDVWKISRGDPGDEIRWIYKTGELIASYTLQ